MASTIEVATGTRHGALILFSDGDGTRHAVRMSSVIAVSDLDQMQDAALLQLPGGRAVAVRVPLDQVLEWFLDVGAAPPGRMTREAAQAALSLANLRQVVAGVVRLLLDEGVVPAPEMEALRDDCLVAANRLARDGSPLRQACGAAAARDLQELFEAALPGGPGARP